MWIGRGISLACLVFIAWRLHVLAGGLEDFPLGRSDALFLLVLTGLLSLWVYFYCLMWGEAVAFLGRQRLPFLTLAYVFSRANLAKYLPGNVMHYVSRSLLAQQYGVSLKTTGLASVLDIVLSIGSAFVFILATIPRSFFGFFPRSLVWGCVAFGLLVVFLTVFYARKKPQKRLWNISWDRTLFFFVFRVIVLYGMFYFFSALLFCCTLNRLYGGHFFQFLSETVGFYVLAWLVGYLTPGASGGIGVREAVLVFLLRPIYPEKAILTAALLFRLLNILAEIAAAVLSAGTLTFRAVGSRRKKSEIL